MMAIALVPLLFIAGSAIDTARLYMVKNRLQQACDAGALAGRRFMLSTSDPTLDETARNRALNFFDNNFRTGLFGTKGRPVFTPAKTSDNQVSGTATAVVPMTLTSMMGFGDQTLTVTCEARYDVADTDIMFVLDTTGSMACPASSGTNSCGAAVVLGPNGYYTQEQPNSKLSALRQAVMNFYTTLAASVDPSTHLRYGFVPYSSTVNAGKAVVGVSPSYIVDQWSYNSRVLKGDANYGSSTAGPSYANVSKAKCDTYASRSPATGYTTAGAAMVTTPTWTPNNNNSNVGTCATKNQQVRPYWTYTKRKLDTSQYKLGVPVPDPSKVTGAMSKWAGCLEERLTRPLSTFDPANLPYDLNPDLVPNAGDDDTRWRPMWPDVVYYRGSYTSIDADLNNSDALGDTTSTAQRGTYTAMNAPQNISAGWTVCGKPVQRLKVMTQADVTNYVTAPDFVPQGGTYHDVGMIWGTRLLSPNGIFAGDTAAWPGRNPPQRYIVFMTDGDMQPYTCLYGMYGIENYDQRVTNSGYKSGCQDTTQLNNHYARFAAACTAAKNRNILIFVVAFGQTLTNQLTSCASPGQAFYAADNASLNAAFQTIAKRVAMLRISR
ncbi:hypothetical protein A7X12_21050 [Sphingomonas sp. TDK1]|nr:hypothetical protein A7X12_21050 [Sphingomonas sp. TDK1]